MAERLLSRRSFVTGAATAAAQWRCLAQSVASQGETDPASLQARQKAAWRRRSLILDDDGDMVYAEQSLQGPEKFLSLRMHDCRDAGVDSLAWCMMWGVAIKGKTPIRYWQTQRNGVPFQQNMPDPTQVVANFCRANNIEAFGSIRMNDSHDAFGMPFSELAYPLKVNHPELLIGDESQRGRPPDGLEAAMWSGFDFSHKRVREDRLWWVQNTAQKCDLNGVDLNFFRMPWYFKLGEEEKHMPLMTEFIRQARKSLDEISRRRGRPVLLGVRVPGTVAACNRIGLDVEAWLRERLVDRLLTGGGYVCYSTPAEELVKLGHRFEVPVYPCINCPANYTLGGNNLRAAASNFWQAGADGIYLWNFHYLPAAGSLGYGRPAHEQYNKILPEMADPHRLKYLDKSFPVNHRVWEQYQRASAPAPLPISLRNAPTIIVRIGDDIPSALREGKLRSVALRLELQRAVEGDSLAIRFNGASEKAKIVTRDQPIVLPLPPLAVKQGVNQLQLAIAHRGESAAGEIVLEQALVNIGYRRDNS
ncbi:MAG: hypothetical protein ABGX16_01855 [Pirellulales bacterium]